MPEENKAKELKDKGWTIKQIAKELDVSESTVKRRLKVAVKDLYPRYQKARIVKPCPNRRLILVEYDGITRVAIKNAGFNYRPKQEVTLELIDADTCRLL